MSHAGPALRLDLVDRLGRQVQAAGQILMEFDQRIEGGEWRSVLTIFEHPSEERIGVSFRLQPLVNEQ
jgi:hypothetical protein